MTDWKESNEAKIAHLGFIQGVISRMANNSSAIKGWAVAIAAALMAVAANGSQYLLWIAAGAVLVLAVLDMYYLHLEVRYRELYEEVVSGASSGTNLSMKLGSVNSKSKLFLVCLKSNSIWPFYITVLILTGSSCLLQKEPEKNSKASESALVNCPPKEQVRAPSAPTTASKPKVAQSAASSL